MPQGGQAAVTAPSYNAGNLCTGGKGSCSFLILQPPCPSPLLSYLAGVQSALYGLVLSLLICVAAVAVFTTHVLLLLPVLLSILGMCAQGDRAPGMGSARAHGRRQQARCGCVVWWDSGPGRVLPILSATTFSESLATQS